MKNILFISPGPKMDLPIYKFRRLSVNYSGDIITSSKNIDIINTKNIFNFGFHCIRFDLNNKLLFNLRFFVFAISYCLKCKFHRKSYHLVVTYDPLKTGIIGVICASILQSKLAVEVNGIYTDLDVYLDNRKPFLDRLKFLLNLFVETIVLWKSDGIKILFQKQIDAFYFITRNKVVHIFPNHIQVSKFLELNNNLEKSEILFIGFPFYLKGVDLLIDAFISISNEYPEWTLKILGWLDIDLINSKISGHPAIHYHPPVSHDEIPNHIATCSIFVLPSRSEAMGRVLVEAMAAGKARIGSNVGGIPTVINDGVDGLLFEKANANDLAKKLKILIENKRFRNELGYTARERAIKYFTEDMYFKNLDLFFTEVIEK